MSIESSRRLDFTEIPILDIESLVTGDVDMDLVESLRAASTDVGFFYIKNHQMSLSMMSTLKEAAQRFFQAPVSEKMAVAISPQIQGYLPLGYRSYDGEERAGTSHQEGFWIGHERVISDQFPLIF